MRTLKLTLAYDGTRFVGWQRQARGESVQGLIEQALERIEGGPVTVHGAGRTDAGVHALGQIASVTMSCSHDAATLRRAVNAQLPDDIRVTAVADAAPDFHARFSARGKTYRYRIRNAGIHDPFDRAFSWHIVTPLEFDDIARAATALVGTHDFAAFRSTGTESASTVRTMTSSRWTRADGLLVYEISGTGFLRHMVRAIVGTLVEVGQRRRPVASLAALLETGSRADAGVTAPPHGLFLVSVDYD